ncbi:MAG TPA: c-type cytochrome domain-containing protein [Flavitalea sp.]|nr:c-type cytochrome domain-containing protein [Flavitalea sp.]
MLITISEFIGHLHPVLVHLPIGILMIACLLQWLSSKPRFSGLNQAISITILCGMLTAIAAGVSGFLLSSSGDYDEQLVSTHQWFGIVTAIGAVIFYLLHTRNASRIIRQSASIVLFLLIILTGHFGGSLTHGSDYLSLTSTGGIDDIAQKPIPDVQQAMLYTDIVKPLLQRKCYGCHGKSKQKGGLRLDDSLRLFKGGKDGIVLIAGKADESEMIKRLLLPRNHEDHMPPKEKPQLNEREIAVLHWWIASGAPFHKKVQELPQTEKVKPALLSFQNTGTEKEVPSDIPLKPVKQADEKAIEDLKKKGIVVLPVAQNSNYLMVSFVISDSIRDRDVSLLLPLQQQLVSLKLGNTAISDSALSVVSKCKNITKLQLDHTKITDAGLVNLKSMNNLQYLNLVGTNVTAQGLLALKGLKKLRSVYLYQTLIKPSEWDMIKKNFPDVHVDSGGYTVPIFESDTTEMIRKKKDQ